MVSDRCSRVRHRRRARLRRGGVDLDGAADLAPDVQFPRGRALQRIAGGRWGCAELLALAPEGGADGGPEAGARLRHHVARLIVLVLGLL
jgi:hypothetical protein